MKRISSLVIDFLHKHPADCARILEQLPVKTACSLIPSIQARIAAAMMECMVTSYGSECLQVLDIQTAVSLVKEMKTPHAARLLRAMASQNSKNILDILPAHVKKNIHSALRYPDQTIGRIMDSNPFILPETISINDAVKRVRNLRERTTDEIFVVDDSHKLKGVIHAANLLSSARSSSLQTIMSSNVPYLSTRASLNSAALHVGWQSFSTLPVVGKDHILSGILRSSTLMQLLAETRSTGESADIMKEMFSMTKMYWIVMAELVNAVAGNIKERRSQGH